MGQPCCSSGMCGRFWHSDLREPSRDQLGNHSSMHVGQTEVAAGVAVRQALVIEAEQVQHGGVQVVNVDRVLDRLKTELVGRSIRLTAANAAAGPPAGEAVMVV